MLRAPDKKIVIRGVIFSLLLFCGCQQDPGVSENGRVEISPSDASGAPDGAATPSEPPPEASRVTCVFQTLRVSGKIKQSADPFVSVGTFANRDDLRLSIQNIFSVGWGDVLIKVEACQATCDGAPRIIEKGNLVLGSDPLILTDQDGREVCTL